jgi:hypothetical protein
VFAHWSVSVVLVSHVAWQACAYSCTNEIWRMVCLSAFGPSVPVFFFWMRGKHLLQRRLICHLTVILQAGTWWHPGRLQCPWVPSIKLAVVFYLALHSVVQNSAWDRLCFLFHCTFYMYLPCASHSLYLIIELEPHRLALCWTSSQSIEYVISVEWPWSNLLSYW